MSKLYKLDRDYIGLIEASEYEVGRYTYLAKESLRREDREAAERYTEMAKMCYKVYSLLVGPEMHHISFDYKNGVMKNDNN